MPSRPTTTSLATLILAMCLTLASQVAAQETIALWPDGPPNVNGLAGPETNAGCVGNISEPTLTIYRAAPDTTTGPAVLVIPGGGYAVVCMDHEGAAIAEWLSAQGITAAVLKYRLPNGNYKVPLQDAQQAIRLMRRSADSWNLAPDQIGVMGFSAGGHLASTIGTHFNEDFSDGKGDNLNVSHRPDFMVLVYPVVSMMDETTHKGSQRGLLGETATMSQRQNFSNELRVTDQTPPTFLVHSSDDQVVPEENSIAFYRALRSNNVPAELHLFELGGHGYAAAEKSPAFGWVLLVENWLQRTTDPRR